MSPSLSNQSSPTRHQDVWCLAGEFWVESDQGDVHLQKHSHIYFLIFIELIRDERRNINNL
jgi:hypothetical protein